MTTLDHMTRIELVRNFMQLTDVVEHKHYCQTLTPALLGDGLAFVSRKFTKKDYFIFTSKAVASLMENNEALSDVYHKLEDSLTPLYGNVGTVQGTLVYTPTGFNRIHIPDDWLIFMAHSGKYTESHMRIHIKI